MSHHVRRIAPLFGLLAMSALSSARSQTIADYSRAQRAWLEASISQSAARSGGAGASAPGAVPSAPSTPTSLVPRPPRVETLASPSLPVIQVSGVFQSATAGVAEVVVNATAYLLEPGQSVPGTSWRVDAVAVDRVVLTRRGVPGGADAEGARMVFALPAMR